MHILVSCLGPGLAVVLLFGGCYLSLWRQPVEASEPAPTGSATVIQPLARVLIVGAVQTPGLYQLPKGSPIANLIQQAGGLTAAAELNPNWLTQAVPENGQVVIPSKTIAASASLQPTSKPRQRRSRSNQLHKTTQKINLNTASVAELQQLPGIGKGLAQRIVSHRPPQGYRQPVDLLQIPGIGPKRLQKLARYLP